MTAPISDPGFLGYQPTIEPLKLTTGASFVQVMQPSGGSIPAGTQFAIVLTDPSGNPLGSWTPTQVTTTSVSWSVPSTTCDAIPANSRYTLLVTFSTTPSTTYAWYEGVVLRT